MEKKIDVVGRNDKFYWEVNIKDKGYVYIEYKGKYIEIKIDGKEISITTEERL